MYAQCPECLTIFKLGGAELGTARGNVRCGHCAATFDALRTIAEQLPPEPIEQLEVHAPNAVPPQLDLPVYRPTPPQAPLFPSAAATPPPSAPPTFAATRRRRRRPRRNWPWLLGSALLMLTLALQVAWNERARWSDDARLRAIVDPLCARLGCRLPLRHDAGRLTLLSRDIRPHPSVPGALIISATLHNDAPFAQRFPVVEITLSDLDDNRIAMRRFRPAEYLGDARTADAGFAADASTALVFEVVDPGRNAVAFEFTFD